jgi:hypothetical protein
MSLADRLVVKSGALHGVLFENARTGLERGVFLSVEVEFEPFQHEGEVFRPFGVVAWWLWV